MFSSSLSISTIAREAEVLRDSSRQLHYRIVMLSAIGAGIMMLYKWLEQSYFSPHIPLYISPFFWATISFFALVLLGAGFVKYRRYIERGAFAVATITYIMCYILAFLHTLGSYPWQQDSVLSLVQWSVVTYMIPFGIFRLRRALIFALSIYIISLAIWLYFVYIYASYTTLDLSVQDFSNFMLVGLQSIALSSALRSMIHIATKSRMMAALAIKDSLTGLVNRLYLDHFLQEEVSQRKNEGLATSVAVCDIDHFKRVNDLYSHAVGDKVLRNFARILQNNIAPQDIAGRYGGEEFVLIFLDISASQAAILCEDLRLAIESYDWTSIAPNLYITASFGVSDTSELALLDSIITLVHQADMKMYQAKKHGRNQVWV